MTSTRLYKAASVLLVLFGATHTYGLYARANRSAAQDMVLTVMETVHFTVMGSRRTTMDFYLGFGLLLTVFLLFSAVLAWSLSQRNARDLADLRVVSWSFAICHAAVAVLCWIYFFLAPAIVSTAIVLCLVTAAVRPADR